MKKKINKLITLFVAFVLTLSLGTVSYADTPSSVSEESSESISDDSGLDKTSVQTTSLNGESEQSSVQSTSDTSATKETAVQSMSDTIATEESAVQNSSDTDESEESSVQSASDESGSQEISVQSTSDGSGSQEVSVQSTSDDSESEEPSIQLTSYNGSKDISTPAVDSITIGGDSVKEDGSVDAWQNFSVTVSFSEDNKEGLDIESGDTINVSWEAPDGITFTGYKGTVKLYQDGDSSKTQLGTAEVTENGVTITFNDNVTNLQHVKGSVTFQIYVDHNPTSTDGADGTITSGNVTKTVHINHINSDIGFGQKSGTYDTTGEKKIIWHFWVNYQKKSDLTGDITITDTLPATETFDSFIELSFQKIEGDNNSWWAAYSLDDFRNSGCSFEYDKSTNTVTVKIPADLVNGYRAHLRFSTTSTASVGDKVSNTATYTYYENGSSTPNGETHTGSLTVPSNSGTVSGVPKGTIKITKVVSGTTDPIEGVHFRVYKVTSETDHTRVSGWNDGTDYAEIVTGSDGVATIENLEDGYYEIAEVTDNLPNWIATSDIKSVYVSLGGTAGTSTTIPNSVKTGKITATKKWTQSDGTTADTSDHPTVYFKLFRSVKNSDAIAVDGAEMKAVVTASGESTATVSWESLPLYDNSGNAYTYSVKEVDAEGNEYTPSGYSKSENGLTVTNKKNITCSNITATKKWVQNDGTTADTSDHPTVYFQLYRSGTALTDDDLPDGQTAIQAVVTASGESSTTVTWTNLPDTDSAGNAYTYSVKEVDAEGNDYSLSGYSKSENGLTVTNKKNITCSNITATKKWVQNDGTTADTSDHPTVYFQLYRSGTALTDDDLPDGQTAIQAVVTASGESSTTVTWTNLPDTDSAGNAYTYSVKEVDAEGNEYTPSGYSKSENGLTVTNKKNITYPDITTTNITATKKWVQIDGTTADTSDHPTVYFKLFRSVNDGDAIAVDGAEIKAVVTASGESTATVSWKSLPLYDNSGNAYTYSVKEVDAEGNDYTPSGYSKSEDGLTVTNKKNITYPDITATKITATKIWVQNDGTTADTSDHPTIYFQLYRNGTALTDSDLSDDQTAIQAVVTASGESSTTVTWTNLPDTDSAGNVYTYSVKEVDAEGNDYTPSGYSKSENGLTVTNTANYQIININSGKKNAKSDKPLKATTLTKSIPTGDTESITMWLTLLLTALATACILFVGYRKKKRS